MCNNKNGSVFLRIIDANLNRAQEGMRVVEDILRFSGAKGIDEYVEKMRGIRRRFSQMALALRSGIEGLIEARDVAADPGRENIGGIYDCDYGCALYANIQRIKESIRSLEEALKGINRLGDAQEAQGIRFEIYALEKDICRIFSLEGKTYT